MKLFTKEQKEQLLKNGASRAEGNFPVVKLFTPDANCTWLITEIDPENPDYAFGLADLGMGYPELGSVYLPEIINLRGPFGLPVERDLHFEGKFPIDVYAKAARLKGCITTSNSDLQQMSANN